MIYDTLATYYDALVKDEEATKAWVKWIQRSCPSGKVLELACGSGEITRQLAKLGYDMTALDLSESMINVAKDKPGSDEIRYFCQDMRDLSNFKRFDMILCLCDSFNYLLEDKEVQDFFKEVHDHLEENGLFLFDTHSLDRIEEFQEEFNETGHIQDIDYQWSITSEDDLIYQDFAFYKPDGRVIQEHHLQRVYDPQWLEKSLELYFDIENITTDFTLEGIQEGEKYFYVCRRKTI